jgi:hypothetical protein
MIEPSSRPSSVSRSNSQTDRGPQHGPDLVEPRDQAALEQDQRQRDDADRARQLVVAEVDPVQAVGPDRHADAEEQQQSRKANALREQGRGDAGSEQGPGDEDQLTVAHPRRGYAAESPRRSVAPCTRRSRSPS